MLKDPLLSSSIFGHIAQNFVHENVLSQCLFLVVYSFVVLNTCTFSQCNMVNAAIKCANKAFLKKIAQLGSYIAHLKVVGNEK